MDSPQLGAVLVDQSLLGEAARLLEHEAVSDTDIWPAPAPGMPAERLVQLSLLLDAVLLYDRIHVLRGDLPDDADQLGLRRALIGEGILGELDTSPYEEAVAVELQRFLTTVHRQASWEQDGGAEGELAAGMVRDVLAGSGYRGSRRPVSDEIVMYARKGVESNLTDDLFAGYRVAFGRHPDADPIAGMGARLMQRVLSGGTGGVSPGAATQLRTFVYWRLSAHLELPFYPSVRRLADYQLIADHIRTTVQEAVYGAVAASFKATVHEVYEDDQPLRVYLPPALTLFLDHLREAGDIASAVERLRAQSAPLRRALVRLQQARAGAASLRELHAARTKFAEAATQLQTTSTTGTTAAISQAIDIAPAVMTAAANPLDPSSFGNALVKAPYDWIRGWWRRRPYRPAFQLRDRLLAIRDYADLVTQATGHHIDAKQLADFATSYEYPTRRLGVYGPPRRPDPA